MLFEVNSTKMERPAYAAVFRLGNGLRKTLYALGAILFALSLAYIVNFTARNWHAVGELSQISALPLIVAVVTYGATHVSGSAAWILGLRQMGQDIPLRAGMPINFVTQIGKYLPGNVAHYVARAGLASASGVKLRSSGTATLLEVLATLVAAMVVASLAMLFDPAPAKALDQALSGSIALPLILAFAGIATAVAFLALAKVPARAFIVTAACVVMNFIFIGLSFFALVSGMSATALSPIAAIGIFAVAWTAGYVVPGAPAGLGVREAILVSWVGPIIGSGPAITCVILHRVISACVDALVAFLGYAWLRMEKAAR